MSQLKEKIKTVIEDTEYSPPAPFQLSSHGFCAPDEGVDRLENHSFYSANYRFAERTLPTQLIKAHSREKIEAMKSMGQAIGKEQQKEIEADVRQELSFSTPATVYDIRVVFNFAVEEIWILCSGKSQSDKISKRLLNDLKPLDIQFSSQKKEWPDDDFHQLITSDSQQFRLHAECEHLKQLSGSENKKAIMAVSQITAYWDDLLEFSLSRAGEVFKISTTESFEEEWYEQGDPSEPEELEVIAIDMWTNAITGLIRYVLSYGSSEEAADFAKSA